MLVNFVMDVIVQISVEMWIYSAMAFPPLGNYNHIDVSVFIDFAINSKQDAPFHHIAYDYPCADWNVFVII